jgi:hypothetical protein
LEDDDQIINIILNAQVLPIDPNESHGLAQFAPLTIPQQVFGRPGREKYHKLGHAEKNNADKPKKRARMTKANASKKDYTEIDNVVSLGAYLSPIPILGSAVPAQAPAPPQAGDTGEQPPSIFGVGNSLDGSLFG